MGIGNQLYQLQELDTRIGAAAEALAAVTAKLGDKSEITSAQAEVTSLDQQLAELRKQQRTAELDDEEVAARIKTSETRLYDGSVTNTKEMTALQNEVQALKDRRITTEDKVLKGMDAIAVIEARIATAAARVAELSASWDGEQRQLAARSEELKRGLASLQTERQAAVARIPRESLTLYERLLKSKKLAVVRAAQGRCTGCRLTLSTMEVQRARGDRVVRCSSCGRILYVS